MYTSQTRNVIIAIVIAILFFAAGFMLRDSIVAIPQVHRLAVTPTPTSVFTPTPTSTLTPKPTLFEDNPLRINDDNPGQNDQKGKNN